MNLRVKRSLVESFRKGDTEEPTECEGSSETAAGISRGEKEEGPLALLEPFCLEAIAEK